MSNESMDLDRRGPEGGSSGPSLKLIVLLLVVIALGIFFFQNGDDAPVRFLWMDGQWPVWLVIGVSVAAGVVIDRLGSWQWRRARARKRVAD
ncbi:MAG TPA: LapA family protein [Ilumatobacter sp.]|nr:LapA family protein [Ilumatobacter sp.]